MARIDGGSAVEGDPGAFGDRANERALLSYVLQGVGFGVLGVLALVAVLVIVVPLTADADRHEMTDDSMPSSIPRGSLVVVTPTGIGEIVAGDIVDLHSLTDTEEVVARKVVRVGVDARGERVLRIANPAGGEAVVGAGQVGGRVWYVIPGLGWLGVVLAGSSRDWVLPAVGSVLFGYVGWMLLRGAIGRRLRRRRRPIRTATEV